VAPGGTNLPPDGSCCPKVRKTAFFVNRTPRASPGSSSLSPVGFLTVTQNFSCFNVRRLAAIHAPPGDVYSSGKIPDCSAST